MRSIDFKLRQWNGENLALEVSSDQGVEDLRFKFSEPVLLYEDNLAVALSTLTGTAFERIRFDFPISEQARLGIAEWTRSEVQAEEASETTLREHTQRTAVLNFSGGLDSLAAKFILGADTTLVSLDLGGRFAREEKFFRDFNPRVVQTNLVETSLRYNSWSFMGIGPLLLADEISDRFFAFGSILEAGGLKEGHTRPNATTFPPFALCGYQSVAPVSGISEAGTIAVVLAHRPDLLYQSLQSLANPGEEKYFRKIALAKVVSDLRGIDVELPALPANQRVHYKFGQNFAVDLTAMFFIAFGYQAFADAIVDGVPRSIVTSVNEQNMEFMLKADQKHYLTYPDALSANLLNALDLSNLGQYEESDYEAVNEIRELLGDFYDF